MREPMMATGRRMLVAAAAGLIGLLTSAIAAEATCTVSTTPVAFGTYDVFSASPVDSTGTVTYTCLAAVTGLTITLDRGGAATFNPRQMTSGAQRLNYNLYREAARTTIWGDGTAGTSVYSTGTVIVGSPTPVTIFGRIPAAQDAAVGSYANSVTATINF